METYTALALTGDDAIALAQLLANQNGAPVGILEATYRYELYDDAEAFEDALQLRFAGHALYAVVDPQ